MMQSLVRTWAGPALLAALLLGAAAWPAASGAATEGAPKPAAAVDASPTKLGGESAPPADPAFNAYIDLAMLQSALRAGDAAAATDAGLQLAEGERVLQRNHLSGVTSRVVLRKALALATDKHDKETLGRIAKAAERADDKALVAQARNAEKLADQNRAPDPDRQVAVDSLTPKAFARFQAAAKAVKSAQLLGDADALKTIESRLADSDLPATQQEAARKMIAQARDSMPAKPDAEEQALQKLAASSRGPFDAIGDIFNPPAPPQPPPLPGDSGLWFKNNTNETVNVVVKYYDPGHTEPDVVDPTWYVWGWKRVQPHRKVCVLEGNLSNRYYYYYAESTDEHWEGSDAFHFVNPAHGEFSYDTAYENKARKANWKKHGFRKIDTQDATGFTMNLNP